MFAEDKSKHFTSQFDDDQPNKFQLEHIGRGLRFNTTSLLCYLFHILVYYCW